MKVTVSRNKLSFSEVFNEMTKVEDLLAAFAKLKALGLNPPVVIDFTNVPNANSSGIVVWLRFLYEVKTIFKYVNAPVWLVKQFSLLDGFFANGSYVEKLQVQLFSPATRESSSIILELGKDIPILKDYSTYKLPTRPISGKIYEMDFSPPQYLSFISENYDLFWSKIKAS